MSNEKRKDTVAIIFGDSLAYGLCDKEYGGWVNRVRLYLDNNTSNNFVVNLAIPGQNSHDILKRFETELISRYNDTDKFILIFSFGIKDTQLLDDDNNYLATFKDNVLKLISISKKYTSRIYFIGLINPNVEIRKNYNLNNVKLIDSTLANICLENNLEFIKLIDIIPVDKLSEGLHPNSEGHKIISELVLKKIYNIK